MRRIVALTFLALLAACGDQDGDTLAETDGLAEQTEAPVADEAAVVDSEQVAESGSSDEGDYDDDYVEDESGGEFGDSIAEGEADLAEAAAPMDDAQGIEPHAEIGGAEYAEDY